jgi:hypothetical protein
MCFATQQVIAANVVKTSDAIACRSEALLDEMKEYAQAGDVKGWNLRKLSGQCVVLVRGESVTIINLGFFTTVIRYRGEKLYTQTDAVN